MLYRPRVACKLHVPPLGTRDETVDLPIRPRRVILEYNDHNHADTCSISAEWRDVGVDPRFLKSATAEVWIGNADDFDVFTPNESTSRFIGIMTQPKRSAKEGNGFEVSLEFQDYTALFLEQKPFPSKGLPTYRDSLADAWRKICDHTGPLDDDGETLSSVEVLRDRLETRGGVSPNLVLGGAVAARFAKLASVPMKQGADAWAVWQQCVGMMGLISFIDRDRCVVTTSTEHFAPDSAPRLVWGRNILELEESANAKFSDKGVAITSFDPLTGTTLEAFYPPPGDDRIRRERIAAGKKKARPPAFPSERYDFFEYHGVTDPDRLAAIAKRAWEERSRQELEGRFVTSEMFVDSVSAESFDLLALRSGDNVRVEIDPTDKETLSSLGSDTRRIEYLTDRGYRFEVAQLIVRNMKEAGRLDPTFHAGRVRVEFSADGDGGKFEVSVDYHNRIRIAG